jgi:hypothetical protein
MLPAVSDHAEPLQIIMGPQEGYRRDGEGVRARSDEDA